LTFLFCKLLGFNDMYLLCWTTSKEGIFMHYSYEFKLMCVELYHSCSYLDISEGMNPDTLKCNIREWSKIFKAKGV
jgi:transposase